MKNEAISAARAAWYGATEPARVRWAREWADYRQLRQAPLISVLIPTHNRVDLLMARALPSVLAQTYKNMEIIVAAHGCTDGTCTAALGWHLEPPDFMRVLDVPRRPTYPATAENHWLAGPVVPLNAALKVARGDWIARIDDDDTWEPDHLEKLLRFAQKGDYEFVSSAHDTHTGKVEPYNLGGVEVGGTQTWLWRSYLRFMKWNPDCWRKNHNRVNDTDLQERMHRAGVRMGYLDEVTAHVLPRPGEEDVGLAAYAKNPAHYEREMAFN
jgi:glycosyltransferase involved in cell wall biosynthesis